MGTNKFNVNETLEFKSTHDLLGTKGDALNEKAFLYNLIYNNHSDYLINIITNLFKWDGLPNGSHGIPIRSSFFEQMLAIQGSCCVSELDEYGIVFTPATVQGTLNIYGEPVRVKLSPPFNVMNMAVLSKVLDRNTGDKFVYIRNDNLCSGLYPLVVQTAYSLSLIMMAFLSNVNQQKFPVVVSGSKEQKLSMDIMTNKIDSFENYILLEEKMAGIGNTQIMNKDMPYVGDKLWQAYNDILNNFFMRVGINMLPNAKKERMLVDEVNSNNMAVNMAGEIYLNNRLEGCKQVNDMFGLNLSVERNVDFIDSISENPNSPMDTYRMNSDLGGEDSE